MTDALVHIGFHKTASTLLQRKLFSRRDLGYDLWQDRVASIHKEIVGVHPYDDISNSTRQTFRNAATKAKQNGKLFVLSHERLSGYPASGGYDNRLIADRIKSLFPKARLLIIIREQHALLRSFYSQYITDGGSLSPKHFLSPPEPGIVRFPFFDSRFYEFDRHIAYYAKLFGEENVLALPYEMLKSKPVDFFEKILKFSDIPVRDVQLSSVLEDSTINPGRPPSLQLILRCMNALFFRNQCGNFALVNAKGIRRIVEKYFIHITKIIPDYIDFKIDQRWKHIIDLMINDRYIASNKRTSQIIDIDLSEYGYKL